MSPTGGPARFRIGMKPGKIGPDLIRPVYGVGYCLGLPEQTGRGEIPGICRYSLLISKPIRAMAESQRMPPGKASGWVQAVTR